MNGLSQLYLPSPASFSSSSSTCNVPKPASAGLWLICRTVQFLVVFLCAVTTWSLSAVAQTVPGNLKWGPWQTHPGFVGIKSRATCRYTVTTDSTSLWELEFRNDYPYPIEYIFSYEGTDGHHGNSMGSDAQYTLASGQHSGVFTTTLQGSCKELTGLTVDVKCAVPKGEVERCYTQYHLPRPTPEGSPKLGSRAADTKGVAQGAREPDQVTTTAIPKVEDPFQTMTTTCHFEHAGDPNCQALEWGDGTSDAALYSALNGIASLNRDNGRCVSSEFVVTTLPDQHIRLAGQTLSYTLRATTPPATSGLAAGDRQFERSWVMNSGGTEIHFIDLVDIKSDGSIDSDSNGSATEPTTPQLPDYVTQHSYVWCIHRAN
jgi:hypothetical protein